MTFPVLCSQFLRGVGIAVFALVRTGVILPSVLAHHASAGRPLPLVGHLILSYGRSAVVQQDDTLLSPLQKSGRQDGIFNLSNTTNDNCTGKNTKIYQLKSVKDNPLFRAHFFALGQEKRKCVNV